MNDHIHGEIGKTKVDEEARKMLEHIGYVRKQKP
jgi:hypothetical protein